jgi:hypothetical protein
MNHCFKDNCWNLPDINREMDKINNDIRVLAYANVAPPLIAKLRNEVGTIDKMVNRIEVIIRTDFIPAAYALAEIATASVLLLMLVVKIDPLPEATIVFFVISSMLIGLLLLIRDMDNPFEIGDHTYADVDLETLNYLETYFDEQDAVEAARGSGYFFWGDMEVSKPLRNFRRPVFIGKWCLKDAPGNFLYTGCSNRYAPFGIWISNRVPWPAIPVSLIDIPVIERISRTRNRPRPVSFPYPRSKIMCFSSWGIPAPLSSIQRRSPSGFSSYHNRTSVAPAPCLMTFSIRLKRTFSRSGSAYTSRFPRSSRWVIFKKSRWDMAKRNVWPTFCQRGGLWPMLWY